MSKTCFGEEEEAKRKIENENDFEWVEYEFPKEVTEYIGSNVFEQVTLLIEHFEGPGFPSTYGRKMCKAVLERHGQSSNKCFCDLFSALVLKV